MNMRKIIAVLAAALMLCTIIPMGAISVSAADAVYSEDFEDGTLGTWSSSSGGVANLVAAADLPVANPNGGNYAMQTVIEADKYPYLADSTGFAVEANTDYMIKVDVLHTTNNWPVEVIIGGTSWLSNSAFASGQVNVSNTAWTTLSFIFNTGDKTNVYMGVKSNWAGCTVYFDNISVTKADMSTVGTTDGYIYNGDFETGAADPWSLGSNVDVVADPTGSDRGYVMKADEAGSGAALFSQVANNLKANTYYKLSFKVYNYNTATNNAFWVRFPKTITDWTVDLSAASGMTSQSANAYTPRINVLGKTGAWYDLAITFNTGDLTSALISFLNYRSGAGQYYFDNIKIREVKDPSFDGYITNGDFETGDLTGWTATSANIAEENGNYIVQGTNTVKYKNFVHQIVTVEPNTEYAISFKAKAAVSGGQARLYAGTGIGNTGAKNSTYYWSPKTDVWTTYTTSFNSGDATELYINLCQGVNNGGDIYYDDIVMWELKDPSYDGYLYNGDFETGMAGNWKLSQSTNINTAAAKDGTFGAQLIGSGWGGLLGYTFAVENGATYQLTFDAKANTAGFNSAVLVDTWEGDKLATKTIGTNNAADWTTFTLEFVAASNQCYFNLNGYSSSASVDCYVDNVKVTLIKPAHTCEFVGTVTEEPTCDLPGTMTYACECGEGTYTEEIPAWHNGNLTHVPAVDAIDCANPGHIEYYTCPWCNEYFTDANASEMINPWFINITVDCVKPEGVADCANWTCETCGNENFGAGEHDTGVPACQDGHCSKCDQDITGYGCANYDTPACGDGVCYYCGGFVAGLGHENGAWAPCQIGECSYGCGLTYPATAEHADEDADDYCDTCWNHLNHDVDPCVGGECSVCWTYIEGAHTYDDAFDVDCNVCGATRDVVAPVVKTGFSTSADVSGLAIRFNATLEGMGIDGTTAVYDNATLNGNKVISLGAIVTNGVSTIDVPVVYLCDDDVSTGAQYAIRIKNIPADKYDAEITFTPYIVVEIDGVETTIYGEAQIGTYNQYAG